MSKQITEEFTNLLETAREEFTGYTVTMGLAYYSRQPVPQWWICLESVGKPKCSECGTEKPTYEIGSYGNNTFNEALIDIRKQVAKRKTKGTL